MIHFVLLISRQGKVRLTKWYSPYSAKEKSRAVREVSAVVLARQQKQCNFLEYKDKKIIYKRCARRQRRRRSVSPPADALLAPRPRQVRLALFLGLRGRR